MREWRDIFGCLLLCMVIFNWLPDRHIRSLLATGTQFLERQYVADTIRMVRAGIIVGWNTASRIIYCSAITVGIVLYLRYWTHRSFSVVASSVSDPMYNSFLASVAFFYYVLFTNLPRLRKIVAGDSSPDVEVTGWRQVLLFQVGYLSLMLAGGFAFFFLGLLLKGVISTL